ncbi:phage baseplate assembly protein V [Vampirovibrio chlorellavorus]|uniref:phage baseplate assembly protein V n=1 Tax=Vampirovibrio chlorellavorus TaxID=758823 RepID=UPI0026ED0003|nr:phage baseplate assembly protein V [Vampirovibrio chlorellavorus]
MDLRDFDKLTGKMKRRIFNMLARGVVKLIDDAGGYQLIQSDLLAGETRSGIERMQQYGFTGHPPAGSEALVVFMNGDRSHGVVMAVEHREFRKRNLAEGDVAVYTQKGNFAHFKADGEVILETPENNITLESKDGKIYLKATGNIIIQSDAVARLEGNEVEIHAVSRIKWDCGGRGYDYFPTHTDSYAQCTVPGSDNPCMPPEHGGPGAT